MARSRRGGQLSLKVSRSSSLSTSFAVVAVLTLRIRRTGLLTMRLSSSSQEKKLDMMRRMLSMVTLPALRFDS